MKTICCLFSVVLLSLYGAVCHAMFWGSAGVGYSTDDNYYKDAFGNKNAGAYYTADLNVRNKLLPGLQYDLSYLLYGRKNNDLTWEDNLLNNVRLNLLARPSDVFNVRLLTAFENKVFPDDYTKKYGYNQYKGALEVPLYVFDHTVPKVGFAYEKIAYDDFDYDSTAAGPLFEVQQELSPWTMLTFAVNTLAREYPKQHIYETITATTAAQRSDTELYAGVVLSAVIGRDWNLSGGMRFEDIGSNANLSVADPEVAVSSRTLVADYYSYSSPSLFVETVFYPSNKLSCLLGGTWQEKNYVNRPATNSEGVLLAETRKDRRFILTAGITWRLSGPLAVKADYSYENSMSNDHLYTYTNHLFSTGVAVYF